MQVAVEITLPIEDGANTADTSFLDRLYSQSSVELKEEALQFGFVWRIEWLDSAA